MCRETGLARNLIKNSRTHRLYDTETRSLRSNTKEERSYALARRTAEYEY